MMPTIITADAVAHHHAAQRDDAGDQEDDAQSDDPSPLGAQDLEAIGEGGGARSGGGLGVRAVSVMACSFRAEWTMSGYTVLLALSRLVWDSLVSQECRQEMNEPKKEAAPPRPATTVLLLRPSKTGDAASPLEVFMVVRHHQIDSFSGALVFPGGKLEEADGAASLRGRCGGADKIGDAELKFRIAGVREAFEECGVLLARKRGQKALIAAADLKGIEERWRAKLAKDEASIVDLVEAEDLEIATDLMVPYAHWITPTFVPKRFDTWFFLAEAPQDQIALHDGSSPSTRCGSARRRRSTKPRPASARWCTRLRRTSSCWPKARRSPVRSRLPPQRKIVTVQPWVEEKDGKRFLHILEGAGYRNLVREMPAAGGVPQTGR